MPRRRGNRKSKATISGIFAALVVLGLIGGGVSSNAGSSSSTAGSSDASSSSTASLSVASDASIPDGWQSWDEPKAPNYVLVVGPAVVRYSVSVGTIAYSGTDSNGRTQAAAGEITPKMRAAARSSQRQDIEGLDPSGWPDGNPKVSISLYDGKTYSGYFWNRSHLIADSLGGEAAVSNLITGTRMQNVGANDGTGGMAYTETLARDWLDSHNDGYVYYSATPLYYGSELIPRAVLVDVLSSDGALNTEVIVYNAAKGYSIDYNTAEIARE